MQYPHKTLVRRCRDGGVGLSRLGGRATAPQPNRHWIAAIVTPQVYPPARPRRTWPPTNTRPMALQRSGIEPDPFAPILPMTTLAAPLILAIPS